MKIIAFFIFIAFFILLSSCVSNKKYENLKKISSVLCLGKKEDSKEFKNLINRLDLKRALLKGEIWYQSQSDDTVFILDKNAMVNFVSFPIENKSIIELMKQNDIEFLNSFINYHEGDLFCRNNNIKIESQKSNIITVKFNKTIYNFLYTNDKLYDIYIKHQGAREKDYQRALKDNVTNSEKDDLPSTLYLDKTNAPLKIPKKNKVDTNSGT